MSESIVRDDKRDEGSMQLANGACVRFRRLRSGEEAPVRELFARLSLRTRYLRFFLPVPVLPDSLVRLLTDVDDHLRLALVAELDTAHGGAVVGLGHIGAAGDHRAEMGLVVADAWQRQGIGVALATALLEAAEAVGFREFVIHGLVDNPALRPLLKRTGDVMAMSTRGGILELTFVRRPPIASDRPAVDGGNGVVAAGKLTSDPMERAYERMLAAQAREAIARKLGADVRQLRDIAAGARLRISKDGDITID